MCFYDAYDVNLREKKLAKKLEFHHFMKHTAERLNTQAKKSQSKPTKRHRDLNKYQVENCPTLPWGNLISTCNRGVKSAPAWQDIVKSLDIA